MVPHDLETTQLKLPRGDRSSLVLFSGSMPRHRRLGYLIQRRYPGLMRAWWVPLSRGATGRSAPRQGPRLRRMLTGLGQLRHLDRATLRRSYHTGEVRRMLDAVDSRLRRRTKLAVEDAMFGDEVRHLAEQASIHPREVASFADPHLTAELDSLSPYLLVAFGGPLIPGRILEAARGLAINQHAGWSPELKGANTVEAALYHRKLQWVGSTVHVMDTHADSGPIIRRSTATLHPDDSPTHCFNAVVALGNELLLEVIGDILDRDEITVCDQPRGGQTLLMSAMDAPRWAAIGRDFNSGWLGYALDRGRRY